MQETTLPDELASSRTVYRYGSFLIGLTCLLQVGLVWSATYPPLVDIPHHMARHYLEHLAVSGGELPSFYRIEYRLLPNLGGDIVVTGLLFLFDPYTACKVFLTLCLLLGWLGPALFILRVGEYRPSAFVASLLFLPWSMGSAFFWGFLNYYSGVGLAFLVLCHFLSLRSKPSVRVAPLVLHIFLVCLLLIWHLAAWGTYGVIVGGYLVSTAIGELRGGEPLRDILKRGAVFAIPSIMSLVLFVLLVRQPRENALAGEIIWGTWFRKLSVPLTVFTSYDRRVDGLTSVLWLIALAFLFRFPRAELLRWHWMETCLLAFLGLYLIIPYKLGTTSSTDLRLVPAMLVCTLAWLGSLASVRRFALGASLLLAVVLLRFGCIGYAWHQISPRLADHAKSFSVLDVRSRVMPVVLVPLAKEDPMGNFLGWAVVEREVFVPSLLSIAGQQPIRLELESSIPIREVSGGYEFDEKAILERYDYVWIYNPERYEIRIPNGWKRMYGEHSVTVWRVE